jgi:hypothetical protein
MARSNAARVTSASLILLHLTTTWSVLATISMFSWYLYYKYWYLHCANSAFSINLLSRTEEIDAVLFQQPR